MVELSSRNAATDVTEGEHETSDVSIRGLVIAVIGLALLAVVTHFGIYGLMRLYKNTQVVESVPSPLGTPEDAGAPPSPRVTPQQSRIYLDMIQEKQQILTTYGVLPEEEDAIHIPIERAMQIVSERGLTRPQSGTPSGSQSGSQPGSAGVPMEEGANP